MLDNKREKDNIIFVIVMYGCFYWAFFGKTVVERLTSNKNLPVSPSNQERGVKEGTTVNFFLKNLPLLPLYKTSLQIIAFGMG